MADERGEITMSWCFHKWSKWDFLHRAVDGDFGTPIIYQQRTCEKCGKVAIIART